MGVNGLDMCRTSFIMNLYCSLPTKKILQNLHITSISARSTLRARKLADLKKVRMIQNVMRKLMEVIKNIQNNN